MTSIKGILGMAGTVSQVVDALGHAAEAVPETAQHFNQHAAASIGMYAEQPTSGPAPVFPGGLPMTPFYTHPVQVDDDDLIKEANVRASFILSRLRFGSSVARNLVAEVITKSTDQQNVDQWESIGSGPVEPGSVVAKAKKRLAIRERLKNYDSPVTADDGELVEMMKEALYLDLKAQAQRGTFKKMSYEDMLTKIVTTELFGLAEAVVEPLAELAKDSLVKK